MKVFARKEPDIEPRVSLIPETIQKLKQAGIDILVENAIGTTINQPDQAYEKAGASIVNRDEGISQADLITHVHPLSPDTINQIKENTITFGFLDPFRQKELIRHFKDRGISAISVEMIPRTTIAQKMDALSSQASLGGYVAVLMAAEKLDKIFPMMMTPAGTISPAKVFIIGAGVAGLQAIATAKRLGARVEAFDTRPVVEEQVQSLGAKFIKIDLGETGQTKDGYAKELTPEQIQKQQEGMAKQCSQADIVITTAQVFGRPAPRILTRDMLSGMKPGSIIVDMAVETGGNVEGSKLNETVEENGVIILGYGNLPGRVPVDASLMYSSNIGAFIQHFWDKENAVFNLNLEDEIMQGCLLTHQHNLINERIRSIMEPAEEAGE